MTNLVDFDRALADFLADGPTAAPEAPVIAAMAHARTTPQRPDPLQRLRGDVMSRPSSAGPGLRSAVLVAVLAVGLIGVAVVGSQSPPPGEWTATNTPPPEATDPGTGPRSPVATSRPFQPIGSPAVTPIHVILEDGVGDETSVDVVDESGRLVSAVAGPNTAGNAVEDFDASNDEPTTLRLSWPGRPCDTVHRLTIDAALTTLTLDLPQCHGDLLGVDRTLILTFRDAVDARRLDTQLFAGRGGVDMPTWTTVAPDSADGTYRLRLHDPGYLVESASGYFDPERGSTGVGEAGYAFDQIDASALRLVWLGPSCATAFDLVLDRTGDTWVLWSAPCETSTAVLRMFDLSLTRPLAANGFKFEARVGQPRG